MTDPNDPEALERWHVVLDSLPRLTLEILLDNRVNGMSYVQIAEARGLFIWQVRLHMLRALRMIERDL